jgi:deoxyadenosine/deoxycytidine kinase
MLYSDPHRWGFAFQANAQMTLARLHAQPAKASIKVMERSIYSARYCFVENLYRKYDFYLIKFNNLLFFFFVL